MKDYIASGFHVPSFGYAICQDKYYKEISTNILDK